jgi:hypothetical protein
MSDATTHLLLPYILAAQAQKHVTHNEALRILDGLVQLSVLDRNLTSPPGSPADGDRYIVGSGATGDWAGWDLNVALWTDGAWLRLAPRTGWRAWVEDEGLLLVYDGGNWIGTTPDVLQNMALFGLGTAADASNPFSAKLNAALWTAKTVAEGGTGDLFYTMNKGDHGHRDRDHCIRHRHRPGARPAIPRDAGSGAFAICELGDGRELPRLQDPFPAKRTCQRLDQSVVHLALA